MGDVIDPRPAQWRHKEQEDAAVEDRVIALADAIQTLFKENIDNPVVQLASLRLVQKALTRIVAMANGLPAAKEALKQASELAAQYIIEGVDEI